MANPKVNKTDVFQFMSVRAPQTVRSNSLRNFYIRDEYIGFTEDETPTRKLREIFSYNSESRIGKILYQEIFCYAGNGSIESQNNKILNEILQTLDFKTVYCEEDSSAPPETLINDLEQTSYIYNDYKYYLLPTKLETIVSQFDIKKLIKARKIINRYLITFNPKKLAHELRELFGAKNLLTEIVYDTNGYKWDFQELRNLLFERLYLLYIFRRWTSINLENIISGLQTIHTLEYLAVDDLLHSIASGRVQLTDSDVAQLLKFLPKIFPELEEIDLTSTANNFFFIKTVENLRDFLDATPVIHPIVAQLHWYRRPFNKITPIGIGDLKVVKQWLLGYKIGEISHIHNIMKGEEKERNHRHLEKTEEIFSFSDESSSDTQQESQTTDRFETKREAEKVIKTDINIGANTNFTYSGYGITASVGANFAYGNSNFDSLKTVSNYARDVMDKTVTKIQNRSTQNRSITKIFETEEKNNHKFTNNQQGATHISGIYRWLDKKYEAQLYNYGKRLMFEFIIPEPAAFYVLSKLKAAEFDITVPQKPLLPNYESVSLPSQKDSTQTLFPWRIDKEEFNLLREKYDLEEFHYPMEKKTLAFIDQTTGNNYFQKNELMGLLGDNQWTATSFSCNLDAEGYLLTKIFLDGQARFRLSTSLPIVEPGSVSILGSQIDPSTMNTLAIFVNGVEIHRVDNNRDVLFFYPNRSITLPVPQTGTPDSRLISNQDINLTFGLQDGEYFQFSVRGEFDLSPGALLEWQNRVYNKIKAIEQKRIDEINKELEIRYNARLADYYNALNELNAQIVNDIIQGRSEAFNKIVIEEELKKHCLTMITKEFDATDSDDILSNEDAIEDKEVEIEYNTFIAGEVSVLQTGSSVNANSQTRTVVGFEELTEDVNYPKINIDIAKKKARYIQFLEQAFEWHNIAYIFYPYFWAAESKWIKLMNRLDYTDNNMTAFLKAGSVRVLIAVTPAYNDAVMHFLATREPWEGGQLPVIGDPLFIPIHEEIRKQQDDLQNAVAEGEPWEFELPTSLIYLQDSSSPIPEDLTADEN